MASALADLFSESSPPPQTRPLSPIRSPSPSLARLGETQNPLFFSPGDTPDRPRPSTSNARLPSPPRAISFGGPSTPRSPTNGFAPPNRQVNNMSYGNGNLDIGGAYDPLDLDGAYGEAQEDLRLESDEPVGKKRRVMAKVDVDRLMGEKGFPALMKSAKRFKPRGKGNEAKDLRDILNVYQLWAHGMFPKGDFEGTIKRVETICRTRRMEIAMKGYREAFYPPAPRSPSPPGLSPLHTSPALPPLDGIDDVPESDDGMPRARPLFARREEEEEEDGPDMDELMAMEEMEREVGNVQGKSAPNGQANGHTNGAPAPDVPEEDEWEGLYDWSVFARLAPSGSS